MDKLKRLNDMVYKFEAPRTVEDYFIGALATKISDEVWDSCLKTARLCALYKGDKRVQPTPLTPATEIEILNSWDAEKEGGNYNERQ